MANVVTMGTFFPRRVSEYCPAMQYSANVNYNGVTRVSFGAATLASATYFLNATSVATGTNVQSATMLNAATVPEPFGRALQYVCSAANATALTVDGWDYLGQPMSETVTLAGATPVIGNKAFKYIRQVTYVAAAVTLSIGTSTKLGLPYKTIRVEWETADQIVAAAGTLAAPVLTDPQVVTSGDPRGTYIPTTTPNGVIIITAALDCINDVNAAGNGGLHGIAQFTN